VYFAYILQVDTYFSAARKKLRFHPSRRRVLASDAGIANAEAAERALDERQVVGGTTA